MVSLAFSYFSLTTIPSARDKTFTHNISAYPMCSEIIHFANNCMERTANYAIFFKQKHYRIG